MSYTVAAFYKFVALPDFAELKAPLLAKCESLEICGTILLAPEGINGTIAGTADAIEAICAFLREDPRLSSLSFKQATTQKAPFHRMKVRLKKEIVTMKQEDCQPATRTGIHVAPQDWNDLISDPDVIVIDTRNDYEVEIGSFEGAINPNTASFSDFPAYVTQELSAYKDKKVAMFCTGGIRCEKASAYLIEQGFKEVFQLSGGILKYLEEVPATESRWNGECFVFDDRVTVDHNLERGHYQLCGACRHALSTTDLESAEYQRGVSCPYCFGKLSEAKRNGAAERQRQMDLAAARGEKHLGKKLISSV